jgi:transcriptional regulator with XRE-family HTH domain
LVDRVFAFDCDDVEAKDPNEYTHVFGTTVRPLMKRIGIKNDYELATKMRVSRSMVSRWMSGTKMLSPKSARKLAAVLQMSFEDFDKLGVPLRRPRKGFHTEMVICGKPYKTVGYVENRRRSWATLERRQKGDYVSNLTLPPTQWRGWSKVFERIPINL